MNFSLKSKPSPLNTDLGQWRSCYGPCLAAESQSSNAVSRYTRINSSHILAQRVFSTLFSVVRTFIRCQREAVCFHCGVEEEKISEQEGTKASQVIVTFLLCCVFTVVFFIILNEFLGIYRYSFFSFLSICMNVSDEITWNLSEQAYMGGPTTYICPRTKENKIMTLLEET